MEPMMVSVSLTMMRMYQPFTNSNLSDHGTSLPQCFLQWVVYFCFTTQGIQVRRWCVRNPHEEIRKGTRNNNLGLHNMENLMCDYFIQYYTDTMTCNKYCVSWLWDSKWRLSLLLETLGNFHSEKVFISGLIPTLGRGPESFSGLLSLNAQWIQ